MPSVTQYCFTLNNYEDSDIDRLRVLGSSAQAAANCKKDEEYEEFASKKRSNGERSVLKQLYHGLCKRSVRGPLVLMALAFCLDQVKLCEASPMSNSTTEGADHGNGEFKDGFYGWDAECGDYGPDECEVYITDMNLTLPEYVKPLGPRESAVPTIVIGGVQQDEATSYSYQAAKRLQLGQRLCRPLGEGPYLRTGIAGDYGASVDYETEWPLTVLECLDNNTASQMAGTNWQPVNRKLAAYTSLSQVTAGCWIGAQGACIRNLDGSEMSSYTCISDGCSGWNKPVSSRSTYKLLGSYKTVAWCEHTVLGKAQRIGLASRLG